MYWKKIKHLSNKWDKYGFVDETEIRIAAWLALILALISFFLVMFKWNFYIAFYTVWIIRLDFVLKVFISPKYSIFWSLVRFFIKDKEKIWVWAVQKRFAWVIWLILSTFVLFCMLLLSWYMESTNPEICIYY